MKTTKRQVSLFLALLLAVSAFTAGFSQAFAAPGAFSGGTGAPGDPYVITTPEELDQVRDYLDSCFILGNDIDLTAYLAGSEEGWEPIGTGWYWEPIGEDWYEEAPFTGTFDGDNYKITGLWIDRPDGEYIGLFGYIREATIKNLGVEIAAAGIIGGGYVGGLVGVQDRNCITNCHATGDVNGGGYCAGGLVGSQRYGSIANSYATGDVTSLRGDYVGGLVGSQEEDGIIIDCYATGEVSGGRSAGGLVGGQGGDITNSYATGNVTSLENNAGGLVGAQGYFSIITNCYATGDVSGVYEVGGLVGSQGGGGGGASGDTGRREDEPWVRYSITNCYATGDVSGVQTVGGLVGSQARSIENSYATGDVNGYASDNGRGSRSGGLVGSQGGGDITNCYATGDVTAKGDAYNNYAGGIVGSRSYGDISNCYAMGDVTASGDESIAGGIVGYKDEWYDCIISSTYRDKDMKINGAVSAVDTPDDVMGGIKTALELRTRATYEGNGWDFDAVWRMVPGFDYPQLRGLPGPKPLIYGDVDGDGVVDMIDAILLSRYVAEWDGITIDLLAADLNGDGVVDMLDSIIMARHIAEWPGYEVLPLKA